MSSASTVEVIAAVRAQFGPDFVPARVTAEGQVREFLAAQLGTMDAEPANWCAQLTARPSYGRVERPTRPTG